MSKKTRMGIVRNAYLKRDEAFAQKAHTIDAIQNSINHHEKHNRSFNLPEIILGGQDGLVNVLGVILGVAAATSHVKIVIVAGLAAAFAESVSMGAVAYTSKIAKADYYQSEYEREQWEIEHIPEGERQEIRILYKRYGFEGQQLEDIVQKITSNKKIWLEVMMSDELKLEPVERKEGLSSAVWVGMSAIIGSFIPLTPFFFFPMMIAVMMALLLSSVTLFIVGYYKAKVTLGRHLIRQGIEMLVIGMVSALVGYFIGNLFKL